jgi:hypothetical protein
LAGFAGRCAGRRPSKAHPIIECRRATSFALWLRYRVAASVQHIRTILSFLFHMLYARPKSVKSGETAVA